MKNTFCFILTLIASFFFSNSAFSQGSGSTGAEEIVVREVEQASLPRLESPEFNSTPSSAFGESPEEIKSFEVTKTVKGNLVKVEEGLFLLKTTKGELLNLKITPKTKIRNKKDGIGLSNGKLVKVTYLPETLLKNELEAVRIKILN